MFARTFGGLALLTWGGFVSAGTCPTLVGQWSAGPADAVAAAGSVAYLGSGGNFVVANVGNPASPTVIGSLALPAKATRIVVSGHYAYVATGAAGLAVIDVADPAHPAVVGHAAGPAYDVAVYGNHVFVAAGVLLVFDASDPTALVQVGTLAKPGDVPDGYTGVVVGGANVVMAAAPIRPSGYGPMGRVDLVLVADPAHPTVAGNLSGVSGNDWGGPWNLTAAGSLALVSVSYYSHDELQLWDVSKPSAPLLVGRYGAATGDGPFAGVGQGPARVAVAGGLAFLGQSGSVPLQLGVLSLSDPTHPTLVASSPLPAEPAAVAISGSLVLVADGWGGLLVFDAAACGLGGCSLACTPTVPASAPSKSPVQFQGGYQANGCTGTPTYDWDFGDGTPHSTAQNPSHAYAVGGNYAWTMTVSLGDGNCSRSGSIQVASTEPPIEAPGSYAYVVDTSAHKQGLNGTDWITDLTVANPGLADVQARLYFMKGWRDNTGAPAHPVAVPLRQSVALADVVQATFGEGAAAGAILVGCDAPLLVASRTYNSTPEGTFGQYVQGRPVGEAIAYGQTAWLIGLSQAASTTDGFRTNLGVVNVTAQSIQVEVALYRGDGTWLGTQVVALMPYDFQQLDRVYTLVTDAGVANGYAVVDTTTQGGRFFAYASVIDNRTGDAIHVPAR